MHGAFWNSGCAGSVDDNDRVFCLQHCSRRIERCTIGFAGPKRLKGNRAWVLLVLPKNDTA